MEYIYIYTNKVIYSNGMRIEETLIVRRYIVEMDTNRVKFICPSS